MDELQICTHEAAHAVAALALGIQLGPEGLVLPRGGGPYVSIIESPVEPVHQWYLRRTAVKLAAIAHRYPEVEYCIIFDNSKMNPEFGSDVYGAVDYIGKICGSEHGPQFNQLISEAFRIAQQVVRENADAIHAVANAARGQCSLTASEIQKIYEGTREQMQAGSVPEGSR